MKNFGWFVLILFAAEGAMHLFFDQSLGGRVNEKYCDLINAGRNSPFPVPLIGLLLAGLLGAGVAAIFKNRGSGGRGGSGGSGGGGATP